MNTQERQWLLSEKTELEAILSRIPEKEVINRRTYGDRLQEIQDKISRHEGHSRHTIEATLTFGGGPVLGTQAIHADFGAEAVRLFEEMIATTGSGNMAPLRATGPIPNAEKFKLAISGMATGGLGFRLEDASGQTFTEPEQSPLGRAIEQVKNIMEASTTPGARMEEAMCDTDPRATETIHRFLKFVGDREAFCTLEYRGDTFGFTDAEQVRRSAEVLDNNAVQQEEVTITGRISGFLLHHRQAEIVMDRVQTRGREGGGPEEEPWTVQYGRPVMVKLTPALADGFDPKRNLGEILEASGQARWIGNRPPRYILSRMGPADEEQAENPQ